MPNLRHLQSDKTYLLAVSGGRDSMVLCHACLQQGIPFEMAHVNFLLRGEESDADENFVKQWAANHNIPCWVKRESASDYASSHQLSIQEAAREIRYSFFKECIQQRNLAAVATAHHAQDQAETVLFHFLRGTGIKGLCGIPEKLHQVVRPILHWTKQDMDRFVEEHTIEFRTDRSNLKTDYTRNKLRLEIIPAIEAILPEVQHNIFQNAERLKQVYALYQKELNRLRKKVFLPRGKDVYIPLGYLLQLEEKETVLYELLRPYGFSYEQCLEVLKLSTSEGGHQVISNRYRVIKYQRFLILTALQTSESSWIQIEHEEQRSTETEHFHFTQKQLMKPPKTLMVEPEKCMVDASELQYPLTLRPWKQGDYMYPLGMNKKKKLARILIDMKMPLHEKENVWVLTSNNRIVWVLGVKMDHRFRVHEQTRHITLFQFKPKT